MVRMDEGLEMKWIAEEGGWRGRSARQIKSARTLWCVCVRVSPSPRFAGSTLSLTTSGGSLSGVWTERRVGRAFVADIKGVH